jgi:precorrin-6B methylase 1
LLNTEFAPVMIASPGEGAVIVEPAESTPKTIGQLLTEAITLNELKAEVIERELGFPDGIITKLMIDEFYTNSVPVVLFKNLIISLHISPSDVYSAMIPTHKVVLAKETPETINKKPHGYQLWENEESVNKYTEHLKKLISNE